MIFLTKRLYIQLLVVILKYEYFLYNKVLALLPHKSPVVI